MLNYRMKLVEVLGYWTAYRKIQDQLTAARKAGNVELTTDCLSRINELRKALDQETLWILNAMQAEENNDEKK